MLSATCTHTVTKFYSQEACCKLVWVKKKWHECAQQHVKTTPKCPCLHSHTKKTFHLIHSLQNSWHPLVQMYISHFLKTLNIQWQALWVLTVKLLQQMFIPCIGEGYRTPSWKTSSLRSQRCVRSKVMKLTPTAIGPLIQFILNPLYKPWITPSSATICRAVPMIDV